MKQIVNMTIHDEGGTKMVLIVTTRVQFGLGMSRITEATVAVSLTNTT